MPRPSRQILRTLLLLSVAIIYVVYQYSRIVTFSSSTLAGGRGGDDHDATTTTIALRNKLKLQGKLHTEPTTSPTLVRKSVSAPSSSSDATPRNSRARGRFWLKPNQLEYPFQWVEKDMSQILLPSEYPGFHPCNAEHVLTRKKKLMKFSFRNGRKPYALADVVALIARTKKNKKDKARGNGGSPAVRITLIGDSLQEENFLLAFCNLARTQGVSYVEDSRKSMKIRVTDLRAKQYASNIGWIWTIQFDLVTPSSPDVLRAAVDFVRNDHPLTDLDALEAICADSDTLVFDWGVHYPDPWKPVTSSSSSSSSKNPLSEYAADMIPALEVLAECSRAHGTTLVQISHPAQHFNTSFGWYQLGMKDTCVALAEHVTTEQADGWGSVMRSQVLPKMRDRLSLIPVPWNDDNGTHVCVPPKKHLVEVFWVPYYDVTMDMHAFHRKPTDCTHRARYNELGIPLWDGIFLARLVHYGGERSPSRDAKNEQENDYDVVVTSTSSSSPRKSFDVVDRTCLALPPHQFGKITSDSALLEFKQRMHDEWVPKNFTPFLFEIQRVMERRGW